VNSLKSIKAYKDSLKTTVKNYFSSIKNDKVRLFQMIGAAFVCLTLLGVFLYFYIKYGEMLLDLVSDKEAFKAFIEGFNNYDKVVFVAIRAFQTVIKIIPAEPLEIGSGYLYGIWGGLLYCMLGTMIGSFVIIALSKIFGKRLVNAFIPVEKINSLKFLQDKDKVYTTLFFIYLIPGTPKDILTYAASITNLNIPKFLIITGIARIPSIITSTMCGAWLMDENYFLAAAIFIGTAIVSVGCSALYKKLATGNYGKFKKQEEK